MWRVIFWLTLGGVLIGRVWGVYSSSYADGDELRVSGVVTSEPVVYETARALRFGRLLVYIDLYPEVEYGDSVVVEGVYKDGVLRRARLVELRKSGSALVSFRKRLVGFYKRALPEPHSSLVAGVVLGSKQSIPTEFWDSLRRSGTAHVVVASGMNVTLVAKFLLLVFVLVLPRRKAIVAALGGVWIYTVLSGFDAPIVRAAVMGSISFSVQAVGRIAEAVRGLVLSAVVMLIVKPVWVFDVGFLLSFVATASLVFFERRVREFVRRVPGVIREDLSTSLTAGVGVSPVLLLAFGSVSLIGPFVNTLVLWTVVPIMMLSSLFGLVGLVLPEVGGVLMKLVYPLSWWFVSVVELFG